MNFPGKLPSILLLVLLAAQGKRPSVASAQPTARGLWSRVRTAGFELLKLLTLNYSTGSSAHCAAWMRHHENNAKSENHNQQIGRAGADFDSEFRIRVGGENCLLVLGRVYQTAGLMCT